MAITPTPCTGSSNSTYEKRFLGRRFSSTGVKQKPPPRTALERLWGEVGLRTVVEISATGHVLPTMVAN